MNCREELIKAALLVAYTFFVVLATHSYWPKPREQAVVSSQKAIDDTVQVCKDIIRERAVDKKKWATMDAKAVQAQKDLTAYWAKEMK